MLRKQVKWNWGPEQQRAFEQIKSDIASIGCLKHSDPKAETILSTDASKQGLGETFWQVEEHGKRPVAFASRYLKAAEKNYAVNELELLAVKWATEYFKHHLLGRHFTLETDHKALVSVFGKHRRYKEYSPRPIRWQMRLLPYDFTVKYVPGSQMGITDYLSRNPNFPAPKRQDESELVIARIKDLNTQKNACYLKTAAEVIQKHALRSRNHQSTVIADLDAHISTTQAQMAHLKKAGGIRFIGDRAEVYRPNKAARKEIRELTDR